MGKVIKIEISSILPFTKKTQNTKSFIRFYSWIMLETNSNFFSYSNNMTGMGTKV